MAPRSEPSLSSVDALAQLTFLVHSTLERRALEQDLSIPLTRLLGILRDRTPTMRELALLLDLDKSSVTGLVGRAEQRGLVLRSPSDTDRRVVQVRLTAAGRRLVNRAADRFADDIAGLLQALDSKDQRRLTDLVTRVLSAEARRRGIE